MSFKGFWTQVLLGQLIVPNNHKSIQLITNQNTKMANTFTLEKFVSQILRFNVIVILSDGRDP
jgi:hypothetical protein